MIARYFKTSAEFRRWLAAHHDTERELLVGFYKKASGQTGISYKEAVDEALCFGWIDGLRRSLDAGTWSIRFSPRKPDSIWSQVNLRHVARLEREGRMTAAGRAVHAARDPKKTWRYTFEMRRHALAPEYVKRLAADKEAHAHFAASPPFYQRHIAHWIMSAKQEATRERRFAQLLAASRQGRRVGQFDYPKSSAVAPRARGGRSPKPARKA
jgi:uncharacterized protein YdeI (YjbR/CyaY-like superfamily)